MRDTTFSILKALAIVLVVVAHASAPLYVARFAYLINVPVFFVLAGYFFDWRNLNESSAFVARRFKRLYLPFLKWSVFFLLIHNLLFPLGLLSEQYGNSAGGVTHPYTWHQAVQNLWSIVFNMSGYDVFLAGSFWFFRALFVANVGFLFLLILLSRVTRLYKPVFKACVVAFLMLALATWQHVEGLKITGLFQGGFREIMGVFFMAMGFMLRAAEQRSMPAKFNRPAVKMLIGLLPLVIFTIWHPVSMSPKSTSLSSIYVLSIAGVSGFVFLQNLSLLLNKTDNGIRRLLVFIGDNSIYIFGFHLLAFKVVSALKVAFYGLPWVMVGGHPVVTVYKDDLFWTAYVLAGVALPLLWVWGWRELCRHYGVKTDTLGDWIRLLLKVSILMYRFAVKCLIAAYKAVIRGFLALKQGVIDIIEASNPKEEE